MRSDKFTTLSPQPLVSIIIPSFNRASLIGETLDSVLAQTYHNWECIVVDDGSTDVTVKVIKSYIEVNNRISFFKRDIEPKGASTCRNIGIRKSTGDFIMFLDSDDLLAEFCIDQRLKILLKKIDYDFVVGHGLTFNIKPYDSDIYISTFRSQDIHETVFSFLNIDIPWITLNPLYRRQSLIGKDISWDPKIKGYQDIQFHLLAISRGLKFYFFNARPDCFWRKGEYNNIGNSVKSIINLDSHLYLATILISYVKELNFYNSTTIGLINKFLFDLYYKSLKENEFIKAKKVTEYLQKGKLVNNFNVYILKLLISIFSITNNKHLKHLFFSFYFRAVYHRVVPKSPNKYFLKKMENAE